MLYAGTYCTKSVVITCTQAFSTPLPLCPQLVPAPSAAVCGTGRGQSCVLHTPAEGPLHAVLTRELRGTRKARHSLQVSLPPPLPQAHTSGDCVVNQLDFQQVTIHPSSPLPPCPSSCGKSMGRKDTTSVLLCLLCGKLLCSNSYCCQTTVRDNKVGSFTAHVQR